MICIDWQNRLKASKYYFACVLEMNLTFLNYARDNELSNKINHSGKKNKDFD